MQKAFAADPQAWEWRMPTGTRQAHHIVPSTDQLATEAQDILQGSVGVNSAFNGVGLEKAVHDLTLRHEYVGAINDTFRDMAANGLATKGNIIARLEKIAEELNNLHQYAGDAALLEQKWGEFLIWLRPQ